VTTSRVVYLLRIYVSASEHRRGKLLYKLIVQTARALTLAGASVFSVEMSYGATHQVHDVQSDYGFSDIPVIIEIVDELKRIEALFAELGELIDSTLVTIEPARAFSDSSRESP
jgi:PII-like signaling protein